MVAPHISNYQARDYELVDYHMYQLKDSVLQFRGPDPKLSNGEKYFTCIGAAQTFGCMTQNPFPVLLAQALDIKSLNFGYGGAGPRFFAQYPEIIEHVNNGQFLVLQVMSGRSEGNSLFQSNGSEFLTWRRSGEKIAAADAWRHVLEGGYLWNKSPVFKTALRRLSRQVGTRKAKKLLEETRANWLASYRDLLAVIEVPVILLWISKRTPRFEPHIDNKKFSSVQEYFGEFPQLIDEKMVEAVRQHVDHYAECVSARGMPQKLISRFTKEPIELDLGKDRADFQGQVWKENNYYPSPEMHQDAATCLEPYARKLLTPSR